MENVKDDGGPAFAHGGSSFSVEQRGMSLRDWFAGQALSGMLTRQLNDANGGWAHVDRVAQDTYKLADAMLLARKTRP